MDSPLIKLQQLQCIRDERILFTGLNFDFCAGDIVQIEGPNGSGKTTLLRVINTTSNDYSGEFHWQDRPISEGKFDYLYDLLFIGHLTGIKKSLTTRENLQWYMKMAGDRNCCSVEQALEKVGLAGYEDVSCYQLSAGQQRRVALARLYLIKSRIWILDEPFTALDKSGVTELERLFVQHAREGGLVILTTHQDLSIEPLQKLNLTDFQPQASDDDWDF